MLRFFHFVSICKECIFNLIVVSSDTVLEQVFYRCVSTDIKRHLPSCQSKFVKKATIYNSGPPQDSSLFTEKPRDLPLRRSSGARAATSVQ